MTMNPRIATTASFLITSLLSLSGCYTKVGLDDPTRPGVIELKTAPINLSAGSPGGHGQHEQGSMVKSQERFKLMNDGWITAFEPSMRAASGEELPHSLLHHVAVADHDRKDFLCKDLPHDFRFLIAAGSEMTRIDLPDGYGIPMRKRTNLVMGGMFSNDTPNEYKNIAFTARMTFTPAASGQKLRPLVPVWIDVNEKCSQDGYTIPAHRTDQRKRTFVFPFSGYLHLAVGHLHDGAVSLRLTQNTSGNLVSEFIPDYTPEGKIDRIPPKRFVNKLRIEKGHEYSIEAHYQNPMPHAIDGMGIILAFIEPDHLEDIK